ncbi:hypothetical protein L2E47_33460, partial [Pseudomonas aeruginosa]|nr:hypothetical protein [Pseudomonas aeruginosa]
RETPLDELYTNRFVESADLTAQHGARP